MHELSYSSEIVGIAVDRALVRLARDRELQSELNVGNVPVCAQA